MRPAGIITAFSLFCIGTGYLWVEGCIGIAHRNGIPHPTTIAKAATTYAPLFVLGVVGWMSWVLYLERTTNTEPKNTRWPIGIGIAGSAALFFFYIYSGLSLFLIRCGPLSGG